MRLEFNGVMAGGTSYPSQEVRCRRGYYYPLLFVSAKELCFFEMQAGKIDVDIPLIFFSLIHYPSFHMLSDSNGLHRLATCC